MLSVLTRYKLFALKLIRKKLFALKISQYIKKIIKEQKRKQDKFLNLET